MSVERERNPDTSGSFEAYLQKQRLRESTINGHLQDLRRFKNWCTNQHINYDYATYNELLKFIQQAQARNVSKSSINIHLNSISKYYNYLITTGQKPITLSREEANPAQELRLKNNGKKALQHLLTVQELEELYNGHLTKPPWKFKDHHSVKSHQRNTVVLGLMIYQGIRTIEFKKMEKAHINLVQGTVYIPLAGRSNSRILKLQAQQIVPIQTYLNTLEKEQEQLLNCNPSSVVSWLIKQLKQINNNVYDIGQIHSSVIMNWLKQYNIRQVQYMAGHRHISSTERYKQEDLQDLQQQLNLFHPMK